MSHLDKMIKQARKVRQHSYNPYSKFAVGVCLRTADDQLISGCNVENVSYGLTMCAEAVAIGQMIATGSKQIQEVVVVPCMPCGSCRQMIREFANPEIPIHIVDDQGKRKTYTLTELLPDSFGPEVLPE